MNTVSTSGLLRLGDIPVGFSYDTPGVHVTDAHVLAFGGVGGDFFDIHFDDAAARDRGFPQRVAHGLLCLALVDGLKNRAAVRMDAIASLEWQYRFVAPVFVGDRLQARVRVVDHRVTSDPERGIVSLAFEVFNQHNAVVQTGQNRLMVRV